MISLLEAEGCPLLHTDSCTQTVNAYSFRQLLKYKPGKTPQLAYSQKNPIKSLKATMNFFLISTVCVLKPCASPCVQKQLKHMNESHCCTGWHVHYHEHTHTVVFFFDSDPHTHTILLTKILIRAPNVNSCTAETSPRQIHYFLLFAGFITFA